jgi:hypothetical protein
VAAALGISAVSAALLAAALPAAAQERGFEFGTRYWLSSGENRFAHDASGVDPSRYGNPTSILTYDELDARALELHWRTYSSMGWFFKGNFGLGEVRDGSFDDEDFDGAQAKTDDTTSAVRGERFSYLTLDVGRDLWRSAAGSTLGVFAGFQQWSEELDGFGLMATVGPSPSFPESVRVITNEVRWRSLRVGVAGRAAIASRIRLLADLAYVPYSSVRNEDSHYLRADLGPVPNIITGGRGSGVQLDLELRFAIHPRLEAGVGVRHWQLTMDRAGVTLAGVTVPVTEFETRRTGLTATVVGRW